MSLSAHRSPPGKRSSGVCCRPQRLVSRLPSEKHSQTVPAARVTAVARREEARSVRSPSRRRSCTARSHRRLREDRGSSRCGRTRCRNHSRRRGRRRSLAGSRVVVEPLARIVVHGNVLVVIFEWKGGHEGSDDGAAGIGGAGWFTAGGGRRCGGGCRVVGRGERVNPRGRQLNSGRRRRST